MKISKIALYQGGESSLLIAVSTDTGLTGWGEGVLHLSNPALNRFVNLLTAFAPALISQDPRLVRKIYAAMEVVIVGQPQVKAALDLACWDIWGQVIGLPLYCMLGGNFDNTLDLAALCESEHPESITSEITAWQDKGYSTFHFAMTGDPCRDIDLLKCAGALLNPGQQLIADGQGQWQLDEARKVIQATQSLEIAYQQPCASFEACRALQQRFSKAIIWNEALADRGLLLRGHSEGVLDCINLSLSREGGLTKAAETRDLCQQLFVPLTFGEPKGGKITLLALAHLALSTPPRFRRTILISSKTADVSSDGRLRLGEQAGLGFAPEQQALGPPLEIFGI